MITGDLYEHNEKKVKADIEKGVNVSMGVDVSSLVDTINLHEINHPGDAATVLALIKREALLLLGKVQIINDEEDKE